MKKMLSDARETLSLALKLIQQTNAKNSYPFSSSLTLEELEISRKNSPGTIETAGAAAQSQALL